MRKYNLNNEEIDLTRQDKTFGNNNMLCPECNGELEYIECLNKIVCDCCSYEKEEWI